MAAGDTRGTGSAVTGIADATLYVDSNVTAAINDLVNVQSAQMELADAGEVIAGILLKDSITSSSTGVPINITPFLTVVMDSNSTFIAATDAGGSSVFDISGGTGAQIVNTSTRAARVATPSNTAQLLCLQYNPQGVGFDSDVSVGRFMILERQFA